MVASCKVTPDNKTKTMKAQEINKNERVSVVTPAGESVQQEPYVNDVERKTLECEHCKLKFISTTDLKKHQCDRHETEVFCYLCNIKFKTKRYLKRQLIGLGIVERPVQGLLNHIHGACMANLKL